jgi:hypothetical protein
VSVPVRVLYFDQHDPREVRTPARDRLLVGVGTRGRAYFSAGLLAKQRMIDDCKTDGSDVVTGWCGSRT